MLKRSLISRLTRQHPILLLGPRGAGKTVLAREYAASFSNAIHLDLETKPDRQIFLEGYPEREILKVIAFLKGKELRGKGTLLVLDEIGVCPAAARWVKKVLQPVQGGDRRSGSEEMPFILATSSMINPVMEDLARDPEAGLRPVRLGPLSFGEFLDAIGDSAITEAYREVPVPEYAYQRLLDHFHLFALIGGMPGIVAGYAEHRHIGKLKPVYESIGSHWESTLAGLDAGKKSLGLAAAVLQNAYPFAATRVSYNHFGNMDKGSREISQAFSLLEQALLLKRIWPVTSAGLPLTPDYQRSPRLYLADTGLVNYFSGIQKPLFQSHDMNVIFAGQIARQSVGQEMLAAGLTMPTPVIGPSLYPGLHEIPLHFWVRNKNQSAAEVDFLLPFQDMVIPVMVRAGEPGRLRALHMFMEEARHPFAVRLYADRLRVMQATTVKGKRFFLLNLPYFLAGRISEYMGGFMRLAEGK